MAHFWLMAKYDPITAAHVSALKRLKQQGKAQNKGRCRLVTNLNKITINMLRHIYLEYDTRKN